MLTLAKDNPLIAGFAKLRNDLASVDDFEQMDSLALMSPFLDVVSSQSTTGVITSLGLASIAKFFAFGIISRESVNIQAGLTQLAVAITHCRFEATDQAEDDGVLLRILSLMEEIVCGECGDLLTDDSLCEIVETCLSMACQMRRGDILRRAAEMTMIRLSQAVFARLHDIEPDEEHDPPVEDLNNDLVKMTQAENNPGYEEIGSQILVSGVGVDRRHSEVVAPDAGIVAVSVTENGSAVTSDNNTTDAATETPPAVAAAVAAATASLEPVVEEKTPVDTEDTSVNAVDSSESTSPGTPYGIFSIREVFRVLVSILDPSNFHQYTDSTRIMSLRLLNVAFEIAGSEIPKHPSLLNLTTTTLAKHLFQLVRYDNPILLQSTLRMVLTLLHTTGEHLKLQQEFLLSYLLNSLSPLTDIPREVGVDSIFYDSVPNRPKLVKVPQQSVPTSKANTPVGDISTNGNGRGTPIGGGHHAMLNMKTPEIREIMIEALTNMTRSDSFFTDLFVNYDCAVDRTDLCEDLIGFLCRNAYPDSATWSTASVPPLCLEAVLALVSSINSRISRHRKQLATSESVDQVMATRARKKVVIAATDTFNANAKNGIKQFIEQKLIPDDSPRSIALFLKESGRLSKSTLGEYLAKPANKKVMEAFIEDFDFSETRIDEALREFLSCFRLPGESQQIEVIFEKFAAQYCSGKGNTEEVANEDSAFILSYAIIMLNTDSHSPQIKEHMTLDQFKRNLRGANDGKDFSPQFLEDIYNTIKAREIIMPDEHDNDETFDYAWRNLLLKTSQAGKLLTNSDIVYDRYMFEVSWKPIVTTLSFIFATATDDTVFSRVITGFNQIAQIATHYQLVDVIDHIIACLSRISTLSVGDLSAPTNKNEIVIEDEKEDRIIVSELSVPFGMDFKCQMASVTLFKIVKSCTGSIRNGWQDLVPAFTNLYLYDMIEPVIVTDLTSTYGLSTLARVEPRYSFKRGKAGRDVGLLSTLSSYLTGYSDSPPEPSDEEVDATLCAIDCINSCGVNDILTKLR
ncbi:Arf family guanine nucleotide exchange factor GEA2 [Sugiyamaella lignohabitans]|uniref:Arf family guanine nucleotide exchange factor GEA2 n=1 Tax=Sugiyamaella lignohabitans TaxID=796027 RepID=A0A167CZ00_9ASCO|nr:Arf family guanine nucleotide exchange factor GEA2 [Sugiyamaella lignohabitans]ANB12275.1 Arf family guanine nucleotide exchange factor GEA2 [Sugiyamaella lignohabitans]